MDDAKCIFCGISSDNIVAEENGFKGKRCPECGLVYVSPRPSQNDILNIYSNNITYARSHVSNSHAGRLTARNNLAIIKKYKKTGSLLELGSGSGYFLDEAKKAGFDVCGIEVNKYESELINKTLGILCENSPLSESSFGDKKFDIIYHRDVFSHLYDPISVFATINQKLNDDGLLVFETGNLGDADLKYFKYIDQFEYPGHLFTLSRKSLDMLLQRTGFELQDLFSYSLIPKMIFRKLTNGFVKKAKSRVLTSNGQIELPDSNTTIQESGSTIFNRLKETYLYMDYFICYKVGSIAPKKGRPQTQVIVVRKKKR
jgi:SAM-dependent methyltransferase